MKLSLLVPVCMGALLCALAARAATIYGGMVVGADAAVTNLLTALPGPDADGLHWIRDRSPRALTGGFQWLADARYFVPRGNRPPERLPGDLFEVYWACRTNLPSGDSAPHAVEIWNEPDFYFVENQAADMAAVLKAAWWGVKSERPDAEVLMPSLAFRPARYALELGRNGLASFTEGINVHFYGWAADYQTFLAHHRLFANALGLRHAPLWVTEIGFYQMPAAAATDPDFLARQAAFHERTMIESWAAGVDRHIAFILSHYVEAAADLGLTDPEGRARPALQSILELIRRLPGTEARRVLVHEETGESVGMTLEAPEEETWWTILWSPARPKELSIPGNGVRAAPETLHLGIRFPEEVREVRVGLRGETSLDPAQLTRAEISPERNLHLRVSAPRFELEGCRWVPIQRWRSWRPRVSLRAWAELDELPPRSAPSPVVSQWVLPALEAHKPSQTWRVRPGSEADVALRLYNFTDEPVEGEWSVESAAGPGWNLSIRARAEAGATPDESADARDSELAALAGAARAGLAGGPLRIGPVAVTVPPLGRLEIPLVLEHSVPNNDPASDAPDEAGGPFDGPPRFDARWRGADGSVDVSSVRFELESPLPPVWREYEWRDFLPRPGQPAAWQVFETGERQFSVEIRQPWGTHHDALVFLAAPEGSRRDDLFTCLIRAASARETVYAQLFLVTAGNEVWRYGEWAPIPAEGLDLRARLDDFAPTIWSRHRTFLFPPARRAEYFVVRFQGLHAGDVLEFRNPAVRRRQGLSF